VSSFRSSGVIHLTGCDKKVVESVPWVGRLGEMPPAPNQPPPSDRPRFVELDLPDSILLDIEGDHEMLRQLAPNIPPSKIVEQANEVVETAVRPMLPTEGFGGKSPGSDITYEARSAFFTAFGMDQKRHPLNAVLRRSSAKFGRNGTYLSPEPFIRNFRLLNRMGAFALEELRMTEFFFTYNAPAELDKLEETFQGHNLSIWETPRLAIFDPETMGDFLADANEYLSCLRLPVSLADVVRTDPNILKSSRERMSLVSSIAQTHGNLEHYRHDRWSQMGKASRPTLRQKLASDIALIMHFPVETFLESIVWTTEADVTIARKIATYEGRQTRQRASLLNRLMETENGCELIGAPILRKYFAYKPLDEQEQKQYPALIEFMPPPPTLSLEHDIRTKPLDEQDVPWLQELMGRAIELSERDEMLKKLNNALLYGSQSMRHQTEEQREETLAQRLKFFEMLGWTDQDHPFFGAFTQYVQASKGNMSALDYVVSVTRLLFQIGEGNLLALLQPAKCGVLRTTGLQNVEKRVQEARRRAEKYVIPLSKVFEVYPNWFAVMQLPADTSTSKLHIAIYGTKTPQSPPEVEDDPRSNEGADIAPDTNDAPDPPEVVEPAPVVAEPVAPPIPEPESEPKPKSPEPAAESAPEPEPQQHRRERPRRNVLGPVASNQPILEHRRALNELIGTFDHEDYTVSEVIRVVPQLARLDTTAVRAITRHLKRRMFEGAKINPEWVRDNVFTKKPPQKKEE